MTSYRFAKAQVSEPVLRKALYWLSEQTDWQLDDAGEEFQVTLSSPEAAAELHRLVNDFVLRETLDRKTGQARERVIAAALDRLSRSD